MTFTRKYELLKDWKMIFQDSTSISNHHTVAVGFNSKHSGSAERSSMILWTPWLACSIVLRSLTDVNESSKLLGQS